MKCFSCDSEYVQHIIPEGHIYGYFECVDCGCLMPETNNENEDSSIYVTSCPWCDRTIGYCLDFDLEDYGGICSLCFEDIEENIEE